jgi:sarcosine oxidase
MGGRGVRTFDVAVVGLGVMGAAIARELAAGGLRTVAFEQHDVPHALGSSHGSSRVIRTAYFEDARYVPLLRRAFELWEGLEKESARALLRRTGAVHIGAPEHAGIRGVLEAVNAHGLDFEVLEADEVTRRFPALVPGAGMVGVTERDAGILSAEACVSALAESALRHGAVIHARTEVLSLERAGSAFEVRTTRGAFGVGAVVLAPGAWLAGSTLGLVPTLPLVVERQVQLWFDKTSPVGDELPVFIQFMADRSYYGMPPHGVPGVKVCRHHGGERTTADALDRALRPEDEADVRGFLAAHLPHTNGSLLGARVCMYTNTPDEHFVIGAHPGEPGVFVAGGFSGHGFKLAPVVGEIVRDLVKNGATRHAVELFDPARLAPSAQ